MRDPSLARVTRPKRIIRQNIKHGRRVEMNQLELVRRERIRDLDLDVRSVQLVDDVDK